MHGISCGIEGRNQRVERAFRKSQLAIFGERYLSYCRLVVALWPLHPAVRSIHPSRNIMNSTLSCDSNGTVYSGILNSLSRLWKAALQCHRTLVFRSKQLTIHL
jgi:hypothetical protein